MSPYLDKFFHSRLYVGNSTQPVYEPITVTASNTGGTSTVTGNVYVPQTPEVYDYDLDGNLLSDGRWSYTWDGENRLIGMQSIATAPAAAKKKMNFQYDYMGRRISKTVYEWDTPTSAWIAGHPRMFYYDGWNLYGETENSEVKGEYVWGLDQSGTLEGAGGVGGLLSVTTSAGLSYAVSDANGNVMKLVDSSTVKSAADYEYGPFGELLRMTGSASEENPFRFSTKYQDTESGLLYYGLRYYSPSTGRWLSRDPIEELGGISLYAAGLNNLVGNYDYLGLDVFSGVLRRISAVASAAYGEIGSTISSLAHQAVSKAEGKFTELAHRSKIGTTYELRYPSLKAGIASMGGNVRFRVFATGDCCVAVEGIGGAYLDFSGGTLITLAGGATVSISGRYIKCRLDGNYDYGSFATIGARIGARLGVKYEVDAASVQAFGEGGYYGVAKKILGSGSFKYSDGMYMRGVIGLGLGGFEFRRQWAFYYGDQEPAIE